MTGPGRRMLGWALVGFAALSALLSLAAPSDAHDFEETRRLVLSIEADHVDLLVAYEVRPGARAEGLIARFDQNGDGHATTDLERLARMRTITPRLRHGLAISADGDALAFNLRDVEFPSPPTEGGRPGVAAVALYRAPLPRPATAAHPVEFLVRNRGAVGAITLEAQTTQSLGLTAPALTARPDDPVLGPNPLSEGARIALQVRPR